MIKMMYDDELYSWYPNDNIQSSNIIREYRMIYITLLKYNDSVKITEVVET